MAVRYNPNPARITEPLYKVEELKNLLREHQFHLGKPCIQAGTQQGLRQKAGLQQAELS